MWSGIGMRSRCFSHLLTSPKARRRSSAHRNEPVECAPLHRRCSACLRAGPAPHAPPPPLCAQARAFARKTLFLALVAGVLLGLLIGGPGSPFCLSLMGAGPGTALYPAALTYARVRAFGMPFGMLCSAMEGIFRGRGDTCAAARRGTHAPAAARLADFS
jgi:hypothetical protein